MARHHRRKKDALQDLELTTFLNLMVVLISFLLVTAVFSRITIQELKLPTAASGDAELDTPLLILEVILRNQGIEISDGKGVIATMTKTGDQHDIDKLSAYLQNVKAQHQDKTDATLLVESDIPYQDVIRVMDAVKTARIRQPGQDQVQQMELFPDVSVGDAP
jgi:biopolymer transport protein ExbD